jgi:NAD(P)-dependent dehydrogenase (short-subunit alcohol dehydrogenase family)
MTEAQAAAVGPRHLAPDLLAGRTALVTGGGTGLGLAIARTFLEHGARVIICGRRESVLEDAIRGLSARHGERIDYLVCDIRSSESVERMFDAIAAMGPLDILVNNAAATFIAQTEALSHRAADAVLAVTLHGSVYCTLAAGRRWIEAGHKGVVLSILSTSVLTGRAFTVPSAIAKAGLLAMTRSLAVEWGPWGIRLVAIAPGTFPTPTMSSQLDPPSRSRDVAAEVPLGRLGEHVELAGLAAFMVSDAASYMTGEMVVLDGGAHLRTSGVEDLVGWSGDRWSHHRESLGRTSGTRPNEQEVGTSS